MIFHLVSDISEESVVLIVWKSFSASLFSETAVSETAVSDTLDLFGLDFCNESCVSALDF